MTLGLGDGLACGKGQLRVVCEVAKGSGVDGWSSSLVWRTQGIAHGSSQQASPHAILVHFNINPVS